MKFDDFYAGQIIEAPPRPYAVSEAQIVGFASAYDPQWFHTDPAAATGHRFGGLIASGWRTCAIAMRLLVDAALHDSESFASPGLSYVKWPNPVRPGDSLTVRAEVIEARRSRGQTLLGILRWRMFNAAGAEVLDLEATSLFQLSPS